MMSTEQLVYNMMRQNVPYSVWADGELKDGSRLMFIPDMRNKKYRYLSHYMLRGMVIKMPENKILVMPQQSIVYLDSKDNNTPINAKLSRGEYVVTRAYDCTTVSLYWYNKRLCIGSNSCPDISAYKWNDEQTFSTMFYELACKVAPEFVTATGLEKIDDESIIWDIPENISVTIGFRSHKIQILKDDPEYIRLVHAMNMDTTTIEQLDILESINIKNTPITINSVEDAITKCSSSLSKAVYDKGIDRFNYGYVLEDKNNDEKIFIASDLYTLLRDSIYNSTFCRKNSTVERRCATNIIYICLSRRDKALRNLKKVLPQLAPMVDECIQHINNICDKVRVYVDNPVLDDESLVSTIGSLIKVNESDYSPSTDTKYDIIKDFVYRTIYVNSITDEYLNSKNK